MRLDAASSARTVIGHWQLVIGHCMRYYDVTRPIHPGMSVYPSDPSVAVRRVSSIAAGAPANVSELRLGSHTGTHVDPPLHFRDGTPGVDELPLDLLIGPAYLYDLAVGDRIDVPHLAGLDLALFPRVLFKTCRANDPSSVGAGLTAQAARTLLAAGVRLVGLDSSSADPPSADDFPAHRILLSAGVIILEGLDLSLVPPGTYELLCLPLKIRAGDGAPARVALRASD
jgi:arylformamidase